MKGDVLGKSRCVCGGVSSRLALRSGKSERERVGGDSAKEE